VEVSIDVSCLTQLFGALAKGKVIRLAHHLHLALREPPPSPPTCPSPTHHAAPADGDPAR
jgi:hypothetical protein